MSSTPSGHLLSRLRYAPASGAIVGAREEQQDEALIELFEAEGGGPALLLVVADGMGGHAGGREASRVAVEAFARTFRANSGAKFRPRLREALDAANQAVGARAATSRELKGMGCTIVAAVLAGNYLRWISVGDSLLFAIKNRQVIRLNADHSLAPELDRAVREGRISQEEADRDPDRHVLRSAVTGGRLNLIDEGARRLGEGALVLLASDGILTLPDDRLAGIASAGKTAKQIVEELLSAIEAGMPPDQDNTTLVAAHCEGAEGVASRKRRLRRRALGLVALLIAILAGALAAYILIGGNWPDGETAPKRPSGDLPRRTVPPPAPPPPGAFERNPFEARPPARGRPDAAPGRTKSRTPAAERRGVAGGARETHAAPPPGEANSASRGAGPPAVSPSGNPGRTDRNDRAAANTVGDAPPGRAPR